MSHSNTRLAKATSAYARWVIRRPGTVLVTLLALGAVSTYLASKITIEPNQLDLISQDLPEVIEVKRVIDMIGGAGHLMLALRSTDVKTLKDISDDLADRFKADPANVRNVTYKLPVEFIQENMVLFIKTEDLLEAKKRINAYLRDQLRRANPFFIEIKKTEPVALDLSDLLDKYSRLGKKSIRDDYNLSDDRQMLLMMVKPMWNNTELARTKEYLEGLRADLAAYAQQKGVRLVEDYERMGDDKTVYYGFTGSYKQSLDDSYAIADSLGPVSVIAFLAIFAIAVVFFRKAAPSLIVISGMVLGTVLTMGFTKITVGELNMITSILGGIIMGFGVDYGIHFTYRTRIELGAGKRWDEAIHDALVNAGRPALIAAIVTAGSFMMLMVSEFRGFSQFGFLAGFGTLIIGFTLFSWSPALLALAGRHDPKWPARLIGTMAPPRGANESGEIRIPRPRLMLGLCTACVLALCAFAIPWTNDELPADRAPTLWERLKSGITFNYNTRALIPENQPSVILQDEINRRFNISSDPTAVYTPTLEDAREVYEQLTRHPDRYSSVDQVVSVFTFVPPKATAEANAKVLAEWQAELKDIDVTSLPPELQDKATQFMKMLQARPFDEHGVPAIYADMFKSLPTALPENKGYLTFIYPGVNLWDGRKMLEFADQTRDITTASGKVFHSAGLPILYAKLARIVLADGKLTVLLTTLWILLMHYLDFRSAKLALASVLPLGVGLVMMLGLMSLSNLQLNFMNIIILPILLGFGVSHGLYLLHRFLEGTSPVVALRSVGAAVASSTLTAIAGFGSLFAASHNGLKSMGTVACLGLATTLVVSFTVLAAVLELIHEGRVHAESPIGRGG